MPTPRPQTAPRHAPAGGAARTAPQPGGRTRPTPEPLGNYLDQIARAFSRRPLYHGFGWLGFFIILVVLHLQSDTYPWWLTVICEGVTIVSYAIAVYANLFYLFPTYLRTGHYWIYLGTLIILSFIITPIELILKYGLLAAYPLEQAALVRNIDAYILSTFFVVAFSSVGKIMVDWIVANREKQRVENESMQSELRFLKSQINPHFLFNTLNSLYALTLKKDEKAPDIVIKLSEMMRYMLYECNEPTVPLRKEINYLRNYLDMEGLRQRDGIDIQLAVNGPVNDQELAPLLLIPFLENSFKHGVNAALRDGFVHARVDIEPDRLRFTVQNSKADRLPTHDVHAGKKSGGIGLVNVRRRLDLLYPERHTLELEETPGMYAVRLELEL